MKLEFKPEDFGDLNLRHDLSGAPGPSPRQIADIANKRLAEMLAEAPILLKAYPTGEWFTDKNPKLGDYTHTAKLVCIELIK